MAANITYMYFSLYIVYNAIAKYQRKKTVFSRLSNSVKLFSILYDANKRQ